MVKLKSHSGAKKRFRLKASGLVKRKGANRNHILTKKSPKRKRHARVASSYLNKSDAVLAIRMLRGS